MVILRERDVYFKFIAYIMPDNLPLEALDKTVGAKLKRVLLALAAFERLAVDKSLEIDHRGISVLGGAAFHRNHTAILRLHAGKLGVDLCVGRLRYLLFNLNTLVALDRYLRLDGDGRLEAVAVLPDLHNLDIGAVDRFDALFLHRVLIGGGIRIINGFLVKHTLAVQALNHFSGRFAAAETGNIHPLAVALECRVNRLFKRFSVHLDFKLHAFVVICFHRCN